MSGLNENTLMIFEFHSLVASRKLEITSEETDNIKISSRQFRE